MGLDITRYKMLPANVESGSVRYIEECGELHDWASFLEAKTGQNYLFYQQNEYEDFPKHMKNLFASYCLGKGIENPFTPKEMDCLFGLDDGIEDLDKNGEDKALFSLSRSVSENSVYRLSFTFNWGSCAEDRQELLQKINEKGHFYQVLKGFCEYLIEYQTIFFENDKHVNVFELQTRHARLKEEHKKQLKQYLNTNSEKLEIVFILIFIEKEPNSNLSVAYPAITSFTKYDLCIKVQETGYQRKGLKDNHQFYSEYGELDIVTNPDLLNFIKDEFEPNQEIHQWELQQDEYIYISW